jgi:hypothetical protein
MNGNASSFGSNDPSKGEKDDLGYGTTRERLW